MTTPVFREGLAPARARYGSGAISFHWTVAALVVFLGGLGLLFDDIPKEFSAVLDQRPRLRRPDLFRPGARSARLASNAYPTRPSSRYRRILPPQLGRGPSPTLPRHAPHSPIRHCGLCLARAGVRLWAFPAELRSLFRPDDLPSSRDHSSVAGLRIVCPCRNACSGRAMASLRTARWRTHADDARGDGLKAG